MTAWLPSCRACPTSRSSSPRARRKSPALDWFKGFIGTLGKSPLFAEMATKGTAGKRQGEAEAEIALGKDIGARANR